MVDPPSPARDATYMARALFLAERGRGRTTPNPIVGAVVVSPDGVVVGQGAHLEAGGPHAEIHALDQAGSQASGATLYCTLEPCSHVGRTGPCVERIVAAGIRRVVIAIGDPNPRVAGQGVAFLRAHGVDVESEGPGRAAARRQNAPFFKWITRGLPHVTVKTAISADGFVGRTDRRVRLTGAAADAWFHRQRAEVDAIAVGSTTVMVDDPKLTARIVYRHRPLTRVIFDRRGRVPEGARVFSTLSAGPVIMFLAPEALEARRRTLEARGVVVEPLAAGTDALAGALGSLARRDLVTLLVEGGPALQTAFWTARLVDRVQVAATGVELGTGVAMPVLPGLHTYPVARTVRLGPDTMTEFDVHGAD